MYARFQLSRSRVSARASRKTRSRTGRRSTRTWRGSRRPNLAMYLSSCFAAGGATSVRATNSHAPGNCARAYRSSAAGSAGSASPSIISSSSSCAVCAAAIARRTRCLCARHAAMYCSNVSIPSSGFILFTALRASAPAGSRCAWRASNHRSVPALHNKKASAARRVFRRLSPAPRIAGCICSTPCTRPPSPARRLCSIRRVPARARMHRAPPGRRPVHWRTPPRRAGRCALFAQPRPRRLCAQVHRAPGLPCEINVTVYSPSLICTVNLRDTIPPHRILLLPRALPRQPDAAALGAHPVARQRARRVEDDHRLSPHHLQNSGVVANVRLRLKREDVPVQRRVHVRRVRRVDQVPLVRVPYARKRLERGGGAGERVRGAHRGRRLGPRHLLRRGRVDDARQRLTHPIGHVQLVSAAGHAPRDDEHGPLAGRAARVRHAEAAAGVVVDNAPQPLGERGRRGRRAPGKLGGQRQRPLGGVRRAHHVLRDPAADARVRPAVHLAWRAVHRRNRLRMGGTVIYFPRGCPDGRVAAALLVAHLRAHGVRGLHVQAACATMARFAYPPADTDAIYFVDLCPTEAMVPQLERCAARLVVLDHHLSAAPTCAALAARPRWTVHHHMDLCGAQVVDAHYPRARPGMFAPLDTALALVAAYDLWRDPDDRVFRFQAGADVLWARATLRGPTTPDECVFFLRALADTPAADVAALGAARRGAAAAPRGAGAPARRAAECAAAAPYALRLAAPTAAWDGAAVAIDLGARANASVLCHWLLRDHPRPRGAAGGGAGGGRGGAAPAR